MDFFFFFFFLKAQFKLAKYKHTVKTARSDDVCLGQTDYCMQMVTINIFSFPLFLSQITIYLTFVYLLHEYKETKKTAQLFAEFH